MKRFILFAGDEFYAPVDAGGAECAEPGSRDLGSLDDFGTAALGAVVFFAAFLGLPTFFLVATGADDLVAFGVDFEALARGETRAAKAERRFVTASSSSVLRFVLASTPCRLSQAMASATGILSSFAICPTRVFAI